MKTSYKSLSSLFLRSKRILDLNCRKRYHTTLVARSFYGRVAEWSNASDSKSEVPQRGPGVQIPSLPIF